MNHYKESTGIIIQDMNNKILFLKRSTNGLRTLPGGKVDPGETSLDCAIRELEEETGITGVDITLYSCTTSYTNNQHWKEKNYIGTIDNTVLFENKEPHKFESLEFFSLYELPPLSEIEKYDHILIKQLKGEMNPQREHDFK